jgi:hypothetical protein
MGLKRAALLTLAACVAAAAPATASASELVARNASHVHLKVNRRGVALVQYVAGGGVGHVYYWGGRNRSLGFARDRSGGKGGYKHFRNACQPYDGPALFAMVAACKASDGSYWALQSWMYHVPNYGGTRGARELRLSHWTGALARMWAAMDWSWHGRYHHLYGQLTYRGRGVVPGRVSSTGAVLDRRGRNVAVDTFNSDYGRGWHRVNAMLAGGPSGQFCLGMTPKGSFSRKTGRSHARQYRVSVAGPFVTPDLRISVTGPGRYSAATDAVANAVQHRLTKGRRNNNCFPQN